MKNIIDIIKNDKKIRLLSIFVVMILFIFIINYSLSLFEGNNSHVVANVKVNDLSFNVTSNGGESNDRVLKLSSNSTEMFNAIVLNLNEMDVKYEVTYKVCTNMNCTSFYDNIPDGISLKLNNIKDNVSSGVISPGTSNYKNINIITVNKSDSDYYVLLDLNAGYMWNDLELADMFGTIDEPINVNDITTDIIAYVDGVNVNNYPATCNYFAKVYKVVDGQESELSNSELYCDRKTNTWKMTIEGFFNKVVVRFTYQEGAPTFNYTGEYELVDENTSDWKIRFLTSGTLTFVDEIFPIDVFLVGGGGGSYYGTWGGDRNPTFVASAAAGGGYTVTQKNVSVTAGTGYEITIGAGGAGGTLDSAAGSSGGVTTAFGFTANGGKTGTTKLLGGDGGSGGAGYSAGNGGTDGANGNNGTYSEWAGGKGQGTTTREFGETDGQLYASGGSFGVNEESTPNTGNGANGGPANSNGYAGASGIVVIRNHVE